MNRFAVVDIETTGMSYRQGDRMIQIGLVIVEGSEVVDTYSTYVKPEVSIPPMVESLTNIDDEMVDDAPSFSAIAPTLLRYLDGAYFVAHNVDFDLPFLNEALEDHGYSTFEGRTLDTVELARLVDPTASGYKLSDLAERYDLEFVQPHRADDDANVTGMLLVKLLEKLRSLPLVTLKQLLVYEPMLKSHLRPLLDTWVEDKSQASREVRSDIEIFNGIALKREPDPELKDKQAINHPSAFIDQLYEESGPLQQNVEGFEQRSGQKRMMNDVYDAIQSRAHGLFEVGTGTGKTLGYLVPAALTALETDRPVVISTHTVQLQEQIMDKEISVLKKLLKTPLTATLLKGREHFICLKKFANLVETSSIDLTYEVAMSLAQILVWLTETDHGDLEEVNLVSHSSSFLTMIRGDERSMSEQQGGWFYRDFYFRAKKRARHADLIITNHAVLLTDLAKNKSLLPAYDVAILDEGHHLEEVATKQFGYKLDYHMFSQPLNQLNHKHAPWQKLTNAERLLKMNTSSFSKLIQQIKEDGLHLFQQLSQFAASKFSYLNQTGKASYTFRQNDIDTLQESGPVVEVAHRVEANLYDLLTTLHSFIAELENDQTIEERELNRMRSMLQSEYRRLEEVHHSLVHILLEQDEDAVYWLEAEEKGHDHDVTLYRQPYTVRELLADELFTKKDSVILTSATLAVDGSFAYMSDRLGLEDFPVKTTMIESPFSYDQQVRLVVPKSMPNIKDVGDQEYIDSVVYQLFQLSQRSIGRVLVLFTSYDMLKRTYHLLKEVIDEHIHLVAQGVHGNSRTKLTKNFLQFEQAILLGTNSFWEGLDLPGDDLRCLVIVRLPFTPPQNPLFAAKAKEIEQNGGKPFFDLAVPEAVLRFKQGFGRLIRHKDDRGVVIVLDRRVVSTRYGRKFVQSLPDVDIEEKNDDDLEMLLEGWLY
ncbi:ATP-dependent DNA helicase DinG [Texcoconibacillus texcoconensis]|uniref:3'-5' exonuclease DinG n=1 Tax=Texcoconibacillus texcoconensis TaxID=1095777 RepID=A0A840QQ75_9BACI|nr:ATP-dependent DNA helicase DinG [Texcoconibacillus texcoconensis]MBB5173582.1 ATP-dependent DNA helicase DinG [Texcoconibacillus texcoconensis]